MPSTLVHLAIAAVIAAALLGPAYDRRALGIILVVAALPDLDTFIGIWWTGAHRSLLHTALFPAVIGIVLLADLRRGADSIVRQLLGDDGPRIVGVAWLGLVLAGIAPDLMTNGVNLFYPVHDQFLRFTGDIKLSTQRGLVQTFISAADSSPVEVGSSQEIHYSTGVDPVSGPESPDVERVFLIINSGMELLLVVLGVTVTTIRLWQDRIPLPE